MTSEERKITTNMELNCYHFNQIIHIISIYNRKTGKKRKIEKKTLGALISIDRHSVSKVVFQVLWESNKIKITQLFLYAECKQNKHTFIYKVACS